MLTDLANTNSALIIEEQGKRHALEQWLAASDQVHYQALTDEKTKYARLRDRIATADLRLSAILDATDTARCSAMPSPPTPAAWFMEPREPNLTERMLNELSESPVMEIRD